MPTRVDLTETEPTSPPELDHRALQDGGRRRRARRRAVRGAAVTAAVVVTTVAVVELAGAPGATPSIDPASRQPSDGPSALPTDEVPAAPTTDEPMTEVGGDLVQRPFTWTSGDERAPVDEAIADSLEVDPASPGELDRAAAFALLRDRLSTAPTDEPGTQTTLEMLSGLHDPGTVPSFDGVQRSILAGPVDGGDEEPVTEQLLATFDDPTSVEQLRAVLPELLPPDAVPGAREQDHRVEAVGAEYGAPVRTSQQALAEVDDAAVDSDDHEVLARAAMAVHSVGRDDAGRTRRLLEALEATDAAAGLGTDLLDRTVIGFALSSHDPETGEQVWHLVVQFDASTGLLVGRESVFAFDGSDDRDAVLTSIALIR